MKIFIRSLLLVVCILLVGYSTHSIFDTRSDNLPITIPPSSGRLVIPIIKVDSEIEYVGITPYGVMEAPQGPQGVGLYKFGAKPGQIGTAIIDGHSGWKGGQKAAFDDLHKLKVGDQVYVQDSSNTTIKYIVTNTKSYDPNSDTKEIFNSNDGKSHLNLITCEGVWDAASKSYSKRLVIFTEKL